MLIHVEVFVIVVQQTRPTLFPSLAPIRRSNRLAEPHEGKQHQGDDGGVEEHTVIVPRHDFEQTRKVSETNPLTVGSGWDNLA